MGKSRRNDADVGLVILGVIAWAIAIIFTIAVPTIDVESGTATGKVVLKAPNVAAAHAAGGFAIAGGLCFVGAVLASRTSSGESKSPSESTPPKTNV